MKNNESVATLNDQIPSMSILKMPVIKGKHPQTQKRLTSIALLLAFLFVNLFLLSGTSEHWNIETLEQ